MIFSLRCLDTPLQNLIVVGGAIILLLRLLLTRLLVSPTRSPPFYNLLGKDPDAQIRTDDIVPKHLEKVLVSQARRAFFVLVAALVWLESFRFGLFYARAILEGSLLRLGTVEAVDRYCIVVATN